MRAPALRAPSDNRDNLLAIICLQVLLSRSKRLATQVVTANAETVALVNPVINHAEFPNAPHTSLPGRGGDAFVTVEKSGCRRARVPSRVSRSVEHLQCQQPRVKMNEQLTRDG